MNTKMTIIKILPLANCAMTPTKGSPGAAGFDLYAAESSTIPPGDSMFFSTGIAIAIPEGFAGLILPRSGLACKKGVTVANAPGLIDSDYRGIVTVCLRNHSDLYHTVNFADRIAQLVIVRVPEVEMELVSELDETARGDGGFGSTGV